jgi:hypothetical protein
MRCVYSSSLYGGVLRTTTTEGVWGLQELANFKVHGYGKPLQATEAEHGCCLQGYTDVLSALSVPPLSGFT